MTDDDVREAVRFFWQSRVGQLTSQRDRGVSDQGSRGAVTGGANMDGFVELIRREVLGEGFDESEVFTKRGVELPGFFRPTKKWDLLVVRDGRLYAAIEVKSQVGSLGNNFNNRSEEAIGNAVDIWTAYREEVFAAEVQPWVGYIMHLEDSPKSTTPVSVAEPHFGVLPEFRDASYADRYRILCKKLVLERHYSGAALITSARTAAKDGEFREPDPALSLSAFVRALRGSIRQV